MTHTRTDYTYREPWKDDTGMVKPPPLRPGLSVREDTARRCAEIAESRKTGVAIMLGMPKYASGPEIADAIRREFGLLPTSET